MYKFIFLSVHVEEKIILPAHILCLLYFVCNLYRAKKCHKCIKRTIE